MNWTLRYSSVPLVWLLLQTNTIAKSESVKRSQGFERFPQTAELLSQFSKEVQTNGVQSTNMQLVLTAAGLNVVLETANAKPSQPTLKSRDRTLIAEFENATLALPQG